MAERPSGTVTFLFSDVEGSTRLLQDLGADRYRAALDDHRRMVREAIAANDGHEVDTQGDAFFVAFARAGDAARAAAEIQSALMRHRWPDGGQLRVRMGLHTTEALSTAEGYVGMGVHRGARICAAAHGGQVVLSQVTAELVGEELGQDLLDLGEHRLKDLTAAQRLFQLLGDGLPDQFPPLRSLDQRPTNLPTQPTPLIGRRREVAELAAVLRRSEVRLVTLTGAGGSGKTRLAMQAAAELLEDFADGVFAVDLSSVTDAALVLPAIALSLGVNEASGQSLAAFLAGKAMLLVVDNFEQVVGAAPALSGLLAQAPRCKVLLTSREPLHVAAEHVYPVAPLVPSDAVELFGERAQAALPSFELTEANEGTIARICARLDGLPLAIELAAARITLLAPKVILQRLDQQLKLLTGGARDQPARHQTLRSTLVWSHDLLTDAERRLFAVLGVFAGGFPLDAAEQICEADLDTIASLVDKSLVRREGDRFRLLETVREFALERLADMAGADALRDRHAAAYERMAEEAFAERHRQQERMAATLEADHDNLRAALDWLSSADPARALRLAGALGWFWHVHSHLAEGRSRLAAALAQGSTAASAQDRALALSASAELAAWQGDVAAAAPLAAEAVGEWRALGREQEVALTLHDMGWGYFFGGDVSSARRQMEESLRIQRTLGDPLLVNRAQLGLLQVLVAMGELDDVKRLGPEALALSQRLGDVWYEHFAHHFLADCALMEGDHAGARDRYRRSLAVAWRSGDRAETCYEMQGMAMAAAGLGEPERALRLAGAADAQLHELGVEYAVAFWTRLIEEHMNRSRLALGDEAAELAWRAGASLPLERAVDEALAAPRAPIIGDQDPADSTEDQG